MSNQNLWLEAISALCGCRVECTTADSQLPPQDLVNIVALREFYKQEGLQELDYPSLGSLSLVDDDTDLYSSPLAVEEGTADAGPDRPTLKINPKDFFDPQYDYDFTNVKDKGVTFTRGKEQYVRPCGWKRAALRVLNKYDGGDGWLGTGSSAWPVSYHGYNMDGSHGIILTHRDNPSNQPGFLDAAAASLAVEETRGKGIYSTPHIETAEKFCKRFTSAVDGKKYMVVLQNRINPEKRKECQREGYWLVYVPEGSSDVQTRVIVQESLRPYGILLKKV